MASTSPVSEAGGEGGGPEVSRLRAARRLIGKVFEVAPVPGGVVLTLLVLLGLAQGVSLLLLIPLLGLVGLDVSGGSVGQLGELAVGIVQALGLPLNLPGILGLFVGLQVTYHLANYVNERYAAVVSNRVAASLRDELYDALTDMEWVDFQRLRPSRTAHALTEEARRAGSASYAILTFLSSLVVVGIYLAIAIFVHPLLTVFVLAVAGGLVLAMRPWNLRAKETGREYTDRMHDVFDSTLEWLDAMKLIKSHGSTPRDRSAFRDLVHDVAELRVDAVRYRANTRFWIQTGVVLVLSAVVLVGVGALGIGAGTLILLLFLFARLTPMASSVQSDYQWIHHLLPAVGKIRSLHEQARRSAEPDPEAWDPPRPARIRLEDLRFRYDPDGAEVLAGVDLEVPAHRITLLTGPSGSGKTTVGDLAMGLLVPDEGRVSVDGEVLTDRRRAAWRSHVGYVPQEPFLLNDSVRANLLWARPDATEEEMWDALQEASAGFVRELPGGLDTVVGDRGSRLSGGERQRIALAMALIREPVLLVLDEATSDLDRANEERILDALDRVKEHATVLLITHRLRVRERVDRIYELTDGRVVGTEGVRV